MLRKYFSVVSDLILEYLKWHLRGRLQVFMPASLTSAWLYFASFVFIYSNTYSIELRKLYFSWAPELGSCGISRKLTPADFMLRNSAEWPAWEMVSLQYERMSSSLPLDSHLMSHLNFDRSRVDKRSRNHSLDLPFDLEQGGLLTCCWFPFVKNKACGLDDF